MLINVDHSPLVLNIATDPKLRSLLGSFDRYPEDSDIIVTTMDDVDMATIIPLVRDQYVKAAFIYETDELKAVRHAFSSSLTYGAWEELEAYTYVGGEFVERISFFKSGVYLNPSDSIPKGCSDVMSIQHRLVSEFNENIVGTRSMVMALTPEKWPSRGNFPYFHIDHPYPSTMHTTIKGSGLEFILGRLSSEQLSAYHDMPRSDFNETVPEGRIGVVPEGVTAVFGRCFLHRSTSQIYEQGQVAITTDEIIPDNQSAAYRELMEYVQSSKGLKPS